MTLLDPNPNPISSEGGKKGSNPKRKMLSAPELVPTRENVLKTFWNDATKAWPQRLLSCIKAYCDELPSAAWVPTLSKLASKSWFKVNTQNMAYLGPLPMVSPPSQRALSEVMINVTSAVVEKERSIDGKLIRARLIRIFPTPDQKKCFSSGLAQYGCCTIMPRFSYLDHEYETLPTANHYTNDNQCSSQTNCAIRYVTILS